MKKQLSLLLLPLMLVGCKASEPTLLDKNAVQNVTSSYQGTINALKENVIVKVSATVSHSFPEGYDSYDYSEAYSAYRQFGFVKNSDGTESRAVIDENGETYFEDTDGSTFFEKLDKTNTVKKVQLTNLGSQIRFNSKFENPFDYVFASDFTATELSAKKAEFVSEKILGFGWGVSSCNVLYDGQGRLTKMDITYLPRKDSIQGQLTYTSTLTSDFEFSYPNEKITHLTESSESNSALSTAFRNLGSNYTITSYSDSSDVMIKTYVTDDGIYQHYTGNQENLSVNDILIKSGSKYTYSVGTSGKLEFILSDIGVKNSAVLPSFESLSDSLFHKETSNNYSLVSDATYLNASSFVVPYFDLGSGSTGGYSSVTLKDEKVSRTSTSITLSGGDVVNIVNVYSNYGTTSFPSYFEN